MTITEFLEARIAEDEAVARERPIDAHIHQSGCYYYDYSLDSGWFCDCDEDRKATARVLAECAAKRAVLELAAKAGALDDAQANNDIGFDDIESNILRTIAAVYADHPDYRQEWA